MVKADLSDLPLDGRIMGELALFPLETLARFEVDAQNSLGVDTKWNLLLLDGRFEEGSKLGFLGFLRRLLLLLRLGFRFILLQNI